jgi:CRISPR-associated protein Csh2
MTNDSHEIVQNRSEILFAFDAVDANPNGNPLSGTDRPRIDEQTQQAIVTDVRMKRYLRDQMEEDGKGVYIRSPDADGSDRFTRKELFEGIIGVEDAADLSDDPLSDFLNEAMDVRLFGATFSLKAKDDDELLEAALEKIPAHLTGAFQLQPGKSIHPVETNEQYRSLTSVIATKEDKKQGGFDLADERIKYGFIGINGIVNETTAETTLMRESDVRELDTLFWRALKNQTRSRSKTGQQPRMYLRVEYETKHYHIGGLDSYLAVDEANSAPIPEMRNIHDICVSVDGLLHRLEADKKHISHIHTVVDPSTRLSLNAESFGADGWYDTLEERFGVENVTIIDVFPTQEA